MAIVKVGKRAYVYTELLPSLATHGIFWLSKKPQQWLKKKKVINSKQKWTSASELLSETKTKIKKKSCSEDAIYT